MSPGVDVAGGRSVLQCLRPCTLNPSPAHPQGAESCSHNRLCGAGGDCAGAHGPAWTHLSGPPTDKHSKGTHGFLPQEEVSADRTTSELKLFQEILSLLSPTCSSGHPPNSVVVVVVVVVALGFQHKATAAPRNVSQSDLQVFAHSVHSFRGISAAGAGGTQQRSGGELVSHSSPLSHKRPAEHPTKLR